MSFIFWSWWNPRILLLDRIHFFYPLRSSASPPDDKVHVLGRGQRLPLLGELDALSTLFVH